jgi:hypothetical protein
MGEAKPKAIKVCLTNRGEDVESPWAEDLGPAPGPRGSRRVRLVNVPFLHAKPTWGDVIIVNPAGDGLLTWDRGGVPWKHVGARLAEDGGRWAMIVDYRPRENDGSGKQAYAALSLACAEHDVVCEGAFGPRGGHPGRAYLAVPSALTDVAVMSRLRAAALPCTLTQIHPAPAAAKPKAKPKAKANATAARKRPERAAAAGAAKPTATRTRAAAKRGAGKASARRTRR